MKKERPFFAVLTLSSLLVCAVVVGTIAEAQPTSDQRVADLVRSGKVRVALYLPQYTRDPATGELRGWPIELVRVLGERMGVQGVPVEHPTPPQAIVCLKSGDCDVSILGIDPTRAVDVDYSAPFAQLEFTFLVPNDSSIHSIADADRPEVRIAVVRNHVSTLVLTRVLKQATLVYAEMTETAFDLLRTGKADVFASVRGELAKYATELPGSRVLDESYGANRFGMAVAKGQAAQRLAYMSEFIDEIRASGLLQQIIDRSGLRGLSVVPLTKTN
jgi:polar amino acid transport system substrate-binding protein